ncbi:MAG: hypothetical protein AAF702_41980 [Chloroflexota bacterium]
MTRNEQKHEAAEMGCFLRSLAYVILSVFGFGFLMGIVVMATIL